MHAKRQVQIRSIRRTAPDLRKLSRALIAVAMAQAEKEAAAQHTAAQASTDEPMPAPDAEGDT